MAALTCGLLPAVLLILCATIVEAQGSAGSGSTPPSILTNPKTVTDRIGGSAILYCEVRDLTSTDKVSWYYLDHAVKISENTNVLLDSRRYSIEQPSMSSSGSASVSHHFSLVIRDLQNTDGGAYQCRVERKQLIQVTHTLIIADAKRVHPPANVSVTDHTACCIKEGVSSACFPICDRITLDVANFNPSWCDADVLKLIKCGTDGRNHVSCCRRSQVPVHCLELCASGDVRLGPHLNDCVLYDPLINGCYNEGQVTLPSHPVEVSVLGIPQGFEVEWMPPRENEKLVTGYRVSYRPLGIDSVVFRSTEIIGPDSFSKAVYVSGTVRYQIYVIAVSRHGSSQPSSLVEIHPGRSEIKSPQDISIYECCRGQNVQTMCRDSLCKSWGYRSLTAANVELCQTDLEGVFHCISGGRNHTQCCVQNDIPSECLPLCTGEVVTFDWSFVPCLLQIQVIERCLEEGIDTLPGTPPNVRVDGVEVTQATLEWDQAFVGHQAKVSRYLVRYRPRTTQDSLPYIELSTVSLFAVLAPLQEDTVYEAMVISLNGSSSSLPSPTLVFQTYSDELFDTGTSVNSTGSSVEPHDIRACCEQKMVHSGCLWLCSYDLNFDSVLNKNYTEVKKCGEHMSEMLTCASDNRNHVPCCQASRVPEKCQFMCSLSGTALLDPLQPGCVINAGLVLNCFKSGVGILPRAPENVSISNMTARSIVLRWDPLMSGPKATGFKVQYTMIQTIDEIFSIPVTDWSWVRTTRTVQILQNLRPNTMYAIGVLSFNGNGSSLSSDIITQTTADESGFSPGMNLTTPAVPGTTEHPIIVNPTEPPVNRSQCCIQKDMSSECIPSCEQGEVLNNTCTLYLFSIVACSTDGGDHTDCCRSEGVPIQCRSLCSGETKYFGQTPSIFCASYVDSITFCLQRNTVSLPSQPINLRVSDVASRSMRLQWDRPRTNGVGCSYNVYYSLVNLEYTSSPSIIFDVLSPFLLSPIKPNKYYQIYVVAVNKFGRSQPSAKHVIRTYHESSLKATVGQRPGGVQELGSNVTLACYNEGSPPPMLFEWYFHNQWVHIGVQYRLYNITKDDEGPYTCQIKNRIDQDKDTMYLAIKYKPELVYIQGDSRFPDVGSIGKLKCIFRGHPNRVIWLKDEEPVDSLRIYNQRVVQDTTNGTLIAELDVGLVDHQDYGQYSCQGINRFGNVKGYARLTNPATIPHKPPVQPEKSYPNVTACCMSKRIDADCMNVCSDNVDLSRLQQSTSHSKCLSAAQIYIHCAADGRDHTACCAKNRVWEHCQPMCRGETIDFFADGNNFNCLRKLNTIVDCLEAGLKIIPSPPQFVEANVGILNPGHILVTWEPPLRNSDKTVFYNLFYQEIIPGAPLESIHLEKTYKKFNIAVLNEGEYKIWIRAGNENGQSVNSTVQTVYVHGLLPFAPVSLKGQAIASNIISLSWDMPVDSPSIQHFVIFYRHIISTDKSVFSTEKFKQETAGIAHAYVLTDLHYETEYEIYVAGNNSHGLGAKSELLRMKTLSRYSSKEAQSDGPDRVGLGIGLTVVILILAAAVILLTVYYFKIRRNASKPPGAVSFENPSYYDQPNPVHISGLRNEPAPATESTMQPVSVMSASAKEVQFGYAKLDEDPTTTVNPSHDYAIVDPTHTNGINTQEIKFAMDDGKSDA